MVRCKENKTSFIIVDGIDVQDGNVVPSKSETSAVFSWVDICFILLSICSFLFDTGMDIVVAYFHYNDNNTIYFTLTVIFIAVPALTMTCFSLRWYIVDTKISHFPDHVRHPTPLQWTVRGILLFFQLGPVLRYVDSLIYGIKSWKKMDKNANTYYQKMMYEDADAALLRLFEGFMEAAPQLVLQLYILIENSEQLSHWTMVAQLISIFGSLISLSWALASYHRILRGCIPGKKRTSWSGVIVQIMWYFFAISSRVLCLGLLASLSPPALGLVCCAHWIMMTAWILTMKTEFCDNRYEEVMYNVVLGVVFIFCYLNPVDSPTRYRYTAYYIIMFIENTIVTIVWFYLISPLPWFNLLIMLYSFIGFFVGILFMVIYYLLLHPTENIKIWRNTKSIKNIEQKKNKENEQADKIAENEC